MNQQLKAHAFTFAAPVNACAFSGDAYAFAMGDGSVHIVNDGDRKTIKPHTGAIPVIKAYNDGFISLSDDGTIKTIAIDGTIADFHDFKGAWIDRMAVHENGSVAVPVGNKIYLWIKQGVEPKILADHTGSVTDVCFAPDGLGLAASHRDGVSLWAWPHFEPQRINMPWKGAHLAVTISADKRWIVTAMQEGALHMWNVALKRDYQMSGYWAKPTQMAWTPDKRWLATSGSETVIIWPFDKGGPEGREALQLGWSEGALVSALASHPEENVIAAGFENGAVALLEISGKKAYMAAGPEASLAAGRGRGAITTLAFSPDGTQLLAGSAAGAGMRFDFTS